MSAADLLLWGVLGLLVLVTWVGALAAWRLPAALDRLHAVAFVNIAAGGLLCAAAFLQEGVSIRSVKMLGLIVLLVAGGAALSHATGRALLIREGRRA